MSEINPAPIRQWRLLRLLAGSVEGLALRELAAQVEVSQKTIHRDLRLFQRTGFPVQEIVGSHGVKRWRLEPAGGEIPLGFTFDEALAIYLGWKSLHGLGGSNTWTCQGRDFPTVPGRAIVSPCRDVACVDNGVPCRVRK